MSRTITVPADLAAPNEDAFALGNGIGVVVDGAGLPKELRAGCRHSVAWFARFLADELAARLAERSGTMGDALGDSIAFVRDAHAGTCDLRAGSPSATVAAWRVSGDRLEHLVLCDASLLVVPRHGPVVPITDERLEGVVRAAVAAEVAAGIAARGPADRRHAARRAVEASRNRQGGFWCAQDDPDAARHALTGATPLTALTGVIACSDGATRAYDLLGVATPQDLARRSLVGDLRGIADMVRAAETEQADRLQDAGSKVHDDLTIVAARLSA
ncbi:protein phosphatase 2C domain-containing protein [Amnibacterium sp. CER49]|uniref:protein phosphatase 2C domain-containing protein n=1 Tax=Amnibacterium sp. CER49 TaxID=3039161 RepID=UPI00244C0F41|nr:protein phosphatase 2C domain-containing protein [Amnibacterium sp. CER49]MDH2444209.1 protein phosphatase 2C domain-containing protein [Amnibacterium sp. CER49]